MFYRKKILLNLLNTFGGKLDKIFFTKLLFLFCVSDEKYRQYEFVPYQYGAFSFTAYSDINGLKKENIVCEDSNCFVLQQFDKQAYKITKDDTEKIDSLYWQFNGKTSDELMKITYVNYPYYAKNSKRKDLIAAEIKKAIKTAVSNNNNITLFDIGYEGKSLEAYLNLLIKNNIKTLVDVRKNPISMKYGFSKSFLSKRTKDLDIEYIHIPELGIESDKRQSLNSFEDYQNLFANYEDTTLKRNIKSVEKVYDILMQDKRIAITCFEADKNYCHRYRIVKCINNFYPNEFETEHL
ncbi:MAG: DUF488 domain-containing protein [Endomicrobia bacterium]|nr:DUF488 domain-containing protein [Endomicrobiia bacterium]